MAGREDVFQQAMNMGHSAAWDQQWDRAASFYRQALEEFPDHLGALTNLGLALYELKEYPNALRCYLRANQLSPNDPLPVEKLAQIYEKLGKPEHAQAAAMQAAEMQLKNRDVQKAIDNWKFVTRLNPDHQKAHMRLALVYERMGNKEEAVAEILIIASLFQQANQIDRALQAVNYALQLMPSSTQALDALAALKERKPLPRPGRLKQQAPPPDLQQTPQLEAPAEETALKAELDPISEARQRALSDLANLLFENHEAQKTGQTPRKGIQAITRGSEARAPEQTDPQRLVYYLSQLIELQSRGETSLAARELERAIEIGLDHPAAFFDLGLLHYENGRMESALRMLQHAVHHPDYALGARFLAARILFQLGKTKEAAVQFMKSLSLADAAVVPQAQARELLQIYDPIVESLTQIADQTYHKKVCENIAELLNRNDWRTQLARAREQLSSRAHDGEIIPLADMITESRSSLVVEALARIHELAQAGHQRSAMEEAFHALQYAPTYLPLHALMGDILLEQNQVPEAVEKYTAVAKSYSSRGEARRAVEYYRKIIEIAPHDFTARRNLISQLIATGQAEEAVREQINLAELYYSQADLEMARKTLAEAMRVSQLHHLDPALAVQILHRLADISMQSLDWRRALEAYEQICMLKPDEEKARFSLVTINFHLGQEAKALSEMDNYINYLNRQGQQDRIVTFLENLVNEAPGMTTVRRRLAEFYRQMGRTAEAIAQLDEIGEILLRRGDKAGAIQAIEAILALKPANSGQYLQLLGQIRQGMSLKDSP